MRYVLIGNSIASVGAIEAIRKNDSEGEIIVIGKEKHNVYARPLISYYLMGKTTLDKMLYRDESFYDKNNCKLITGKMVTRIDNDKHKVELDDESSISYDRLLVATGSRTFIPQTGGLSNIKEVYNFMTLDDALDLEKVIAPEKNVLIIGAGLIGLKCAEGIADRVNNVTVVDMAESILSSILDRECAAIVQKEIEKHGVEFRLGNHVTEFAAGVENAPNKAHMADGSEIDFDILVMAAGVRPNISLINDIGGKVDRGIIIDERMQTSIENIYSAGDCTQGYDASTGMLRILALLPNAYMQGECAGYNMSGKNKTLTNAIPMNSIGFWNMHIATAGVYEGDVIESIDRKKENEICIKRLFYKDNELKGFMIIGDIDRAGIYTSLIRDKVKLDSIDFDMISKEPCLMAFAKGEREKKLSSSKMN